VGLFADKLVACNDVIDRLKKQYGKMVAAAEYVGNHGGKWIGAPIGIGCHSYPIVSRISLFNQLCGVDVTQMFPADVSKRDQAMLKKDWTWEKFLGHAEKLNAGGHPYGGPISEATDANTWLCPLFNSFGSRFMDEKGEITIDSDATMAALDYVMRLSKHMPTDIYGWDDASNNRFLISGKGGAIQNPPSAWAVAVKDNRPVGADCWHHDTPYGPQGCFRGAEYMTWGVWGYSKNQKAALELVEFMGQKESVYALIEASKGFDQPAF